MKIGPMMVTVGCLLASCATFHSPLNSEGERPKDADELAWMASDTPRLEAWIKEHENVSKLKAMPSEYFDVDKITATTQQPKRVSGSELYGNSLYYMAFEDSKQLVFKLDIDSGKTAKFPVKLEDNERLSSFQLSSDFRYLLALTTSSGDERYRLSIFDTKTRTYIKHEVPTGGISSSKSTSFSNSFAYSRKLEESTPQTSKYGTFLLEINGNQAKEILIFNGSETIDRAQTAGIYQSVIFLPEKNLAIGVTTDSTSSPFKFYSKQISDLKNPGKKWTLAFSQDRMIRSFDSSKNSLIGIIKKPEGSTEVREFKPDRGNWTERVIADSGKISYSVIRSTASHALIFAKDDLEQNIVLVDLKSGSRRQIRLADGEILYNFYANPSEPNAIIRTSHYAGPDRYYFLQTMSGSLKELPFLRDSYPESKLERSLHWAVSQDKQKVPYVIIKQKGQVLTQDTKILLSSYGAYGTPATMSFSPSKDVWYKYGGVRVYCLTRGAGDRDLAWQEAGRGINKKNAVLDTIGCAEDLLKNGWTSTRNLAYSTASAGGIIAGAIFTMRPDLFQSFIVQSGVLNLSEIFQTMHGKANIKEYGDPNDLQQKSMIDELDGYKNLKKKTKYPYLLIIHGRNDSRVNVWQSTKFYAQVKGYTTRPESTYLWIDPDNGHGLDASAAKAAEMASITYKFLELTLGK